jgi:RNA polymerase sigma-70 factor (ECF subfamily)
VSVVGVTPEKTVESSRQERAESFRALAREQLSRLYSIARRLVGGDAEDAVGLPAQGVPAVRAAARCGGGPGLADGHPGQLLPGPGAGQRKAAGGGRPRRGRAVSLYRKIAYEDPLPYSDSLHLDFLAEFGPDVRAVLLRLPELYRIPLVLVYMDGYLAREAAGMLDAPLGTMLARLHPGHKLFEKQLWDYAETSGLLREASR